MTAAWRDAFVMGAQGDENDQTSGDDDASQQDSASVSKMCPKLGGCIAVCVDMCVFWAGARPFLQTRILKI